jgi:hypothetical protein
LWGGRQTIEDKMSTSFFEFQVLVFENKESTEFLEKFFFSDCKRLRIFQYSGVQPFQKSAKFGDKMSTI